MSFPSLLPFATCRQESWPWVIRVRELALPLTGYSILERGPCILSGQDNRAGPDGMGMVELAPRA